MFSCLSIKCADLGQITVRACKFVLQRKFSTVYIVAVLLSPELLLELPHQFALKCWIRGVQVKELRKRGRSRTDVEEELANSLEWYGVFATG